MNTARKFRKSTNLSLDKAMVEEARELAINLSRAAEDGIAKALKAEKERRWCEENRAAIEASNRYVEEHGLPLEKLRLFHIG
ncbi:MAG: type II toxin-antitoxin system CcdA family antitoxin [Salaquimonas sp.]|nr:type II toxin-antitoxin system CcdA family antitoxin [Salaquimonas sp.]